MITPIGSTNPITLRSWVAIGIQAALFQTINRPHPAQARAAVDVEIEASVPGVQSSSAPSRASDADTGGS